MITRQPLAISLSPVFLPVGKAALLLGFVLCLTQAGRADITEYAIAATNGVTVWGSSTVNGSVGSALGDVSLFSSDLGAPIVNGRVVSGRYVALFGGGTRVNGSVIAGGSASLFGGGPTSIASIGGNLDAGGAAYVGSYGFVTRNVTAAGTVHLDDGGKVGGNVNSGGADYLEIDTGTLRPRYAVEVGNPYSIGPAAQVDGSVTVSLGQTVAIDTADGASVGVLPLIYGTPAAPASVPSITLPTPVTFTAGGVNVTNATLPSNGELPPGIYGDVDLDGRTLRLSSGNYYFDDFFSNDLILYLDAGGPTPLEIYVAGSVYAGGMLSTYLTSGSAQDVYVQANEGWDSRVDTGGTFYGTIYSPYGAVNASNLAITGALYSGMTVYIEDVGISRAVIPAPGAIVLGAIGLGLVGYLKRRF